MSELMIDCITSLDGFGAADGWPGLWGLGGPEYYALLEHDPHRDDTLLMGATTYRLFEEFLQTGEPGIEALATIPKVVFSRSLSEPLAWENTTLVASDAVGAVRAMKRDSDVGLRTLGSPTLCRALLEAGLVDRYRVVVFPVVNGATGQDRMYDGWPDVRLDLIEARTLDGRLQLLEYATTVLSGPPQ